MENGQSGERYILGGHNLSYNEVIDRVNMITGRKVMKLKIPAWLMKIGVRIDVLRCKLSLEPWVCKFSECSPVTIPVSKMMPSPD